MTSQKRFYTFLLLFECLVVISALSVGYIRGNMKRQFAEHGLITYFSCMQLLFIAWLSFGVYKASKDRIPTKSRRAPYWVWAVIGAAFFFLACDEIFQFHEKMDHLIHTIFMIQETSWTDRIDDMIVGGYGLVGGVFLYYYREELKKYANSIPAILAGFVGLFTMVGLDILTNDDAILLSFNLDNFTVEWLRYQLAILEEIAKIFAEGFFIIGFWKCYQMARAKSCPLGMLDNIIEEKRINSPI